MSDVLSWKLTNEYTCAGWSENTYIKLLCADTSIFQTTLPQDIHTQREKMTVSEIRNHTHTHTHTHTRIKNVSNIEGKCGVKQTKVDTF